MADGLLVAKRLHEPKLVASVSALLGRWLGGWRVKMRFWTAISEPAFTVSLVLDAILGWVPEGENFSAFAVESVRLQ